MSKHTNKKLWSRTLKRGAYFALFFIMTFFMIFSTITNNTLFTNDFLFAITLYIIFLVIAIVVALEFGEYAVYGIRGILLGIFIGGLFALIL